MSVLWQDSYFHKSNFHNDHYFHKSNFHNDHWKIGECTSARGVSLATQKNGDFFWNSFRKKHDLDEIFRCRIDEIQDLHGTKMQDLHGTKMQKRHNISACSDGSRSQLSTFCFEAWEAEMLLGFPDFGVRKGTLAKNVPWSMVGRLWFINSPNGQQ